ncbi:hypothetical protein [Foetidibacter luteolus]|uniref:hypothetical protein n=1 Tax=Foetidibacter luteolus TaxID=2608880 RepID=UPI00129BDAF0|nr:hypothetical protein [Foetidibacter luteolus]
MNGCRRLKGYTYECPAEKAAGVTTAPGIEADTPLKPSQHGFCGGVAADSPVPSAGALINLFRLLVP